MNLSKIKDHHKTIAIVPSKTLNLEIYTIYDKILSIYPEKLITLIEPQEIICRLKSREYDFFIFFCDVCQLHSFDISNYIQMKDNTIAKAIYRSRLTDETSFLISRLGKAEKLKNVTVFGIFFTSIEFLDLAIKVSNYLKQEGKITYLIYLNDVCYERLTCIDSVEAVVLLECPNFFEFDANIIIPLVTPFDVQLAFQKEEWDGSYECNKFEMGVLDGDVLCLQENRIDVLQSVMMKSELCSVEYENVANNDDIEEGRKGIASTYKDEGK